VQLGHQLRGKLDTVGIDLEAAFEYLATTADHVQIAAGGLGVDDPAPAILQLFEAAAAALLAEGIPLLVVIKSITHGKDDETAQGRIWNRRSGTSGRGRRINVWKVMRGEWGITGYYCPHRRESTAIPICRAAATGQAWRHKRFTDEEPLHMIW
jgi:hypothetical protein